MDPGARDRLFQDLLQVTPQTEDKPALSENLTDVLEIIAVEDGLKPAHLNGQGFRSAWLHGRLEGLAATYGLLTTRTFKIRRFRYRPPTYEAAIAQWNDAQDEARGAADGDVLWIYRDPSVATLIADTVAGRISCSQVLGYPDCCVRADFERSEYIAAELVDGLRRKFRTSSPQELIALLARDEGVEIDSDQMSQDIERSLKRFPYVQFYACPACFTAEESPAATLNRSMRDLAFAISPRFGADIWRAVRHGRAAANVSRNDACPCGSGRKFKKCCDLIDR